MWNVARIGQESTKKRRNKKFGECITTIRYNVIHMYSGTAATLGEQNLGRYIGAAFIEGLFCTQIVHLGPGFLAEVALFRGGRLLTNALVLSGQSFHTVRCMHGAQHNIISTLPIRSNNQYWDSNGNLSTSAVHVHDVVTDCSYALAKFLVSTLFGAFLANPSNVSHCKCFLVRFP